MSLLDLLANSSFNDKTCDDEKEAKPHFKSPAEYQAWIESQQPEKVEHEACPRCNGSGKEWHRVDHFFFTCPRCAGKKVCTQSDRQRKDRYDWLKANAPHKQKVKATDYQV